MADHNQSEQFKIEDFTVDKMARRITDFWGKGLQYDPFAGHDRSKDTHQGGAVPGDRADDNTSDKTSLPYLAKTDANGEGTHGRYTFEDFYPLDGTEGQPKNWLTFLHPADREFLGLGELNLSESESVKSLSGAIKSANDSAKLDTKKLVKFLQYLNGDPGAEYGGALYPNVAQPFMGDLHNPKVLVVTFNPGFHEFSDWALGAKEKQLAEKTRKKLEEYRKRDKNLDQKSSEKHWIREQDKLLEAITGGKHSFVPWQQKGNKDPNFAFDPPLNCHGDKMSQWWYEEALTGENGNWHTEYFRVSKDSVSTDEVKHIRDLIPKNVTDNSGGLAQVEIFPYATRGSGDVKPLIEAIGKDYSVEGIELYSEFRKDLWPSQRPILDYILSTLLAAAENGTIIICRSSVVGTGYWKIVMKIARALAEIKKLDWGLLQKRCFEFVSDPPANLTLGNICHYRPRPTAKEIEDLLKSN